MCLIVLDSNLEEDEKKEKQDELGDSIVEGSSL